MSSFIRKSDTRFNKFYLQTLNNFVKMLAIRNLPLKYSPGS